MQIHERLQSIDELYQFSPTLQALVNTVTPRMRDRNTRESTFTGPLVPNGKTPFLDAFYNHPELPYVECLAIGIADSWAKGTICVYEEDILVGIPRPTKMLMWEHFSFGLRGNLSPACCVLDCGSLHCLALKKACDGNGYIMRLWNHDCTDVEINIHINGSTLPYFTLCDALERDTGTKIHSVPAGAVVTIHFPAIPSAENSTV